MNDNAQKTLVTIGNFDGVHLGHKMLLERARALGGNFPLVALTFEPHPRSFFMPETKPFRLTPEHIKTRLLEHLGARVEILDFNGVMASLTPQQFMDMILIDHLNAGHVVVGNDFHFGHKRAGTLETLQNDGRFEVSAITLENGGDAPISSTRIRACLEAGDIAGANALLGWEWEIEGEVLHGDKRGRELGYPTANIAFGDTIAPAYGVYAVRVQVEGVWRAGVANIGIRPMFALPQPLLEVYIFDFEGDLYGQFLRVQPVQKLRDEAKFEGLEALKSAIAKDCEQARDILQFRP